MVKGFLAIALSAMGLLAVLPPGRAAAVPTVTITATTPQIQENIKDIGTFTLTRTGSTDAPLLVFYNVSDAVQNLTFLAPTGLSGQFFSGPLAPLNTFLPKGTTVAYIVDSQSNVLPADATTTPVMLTGTTYCPSTTTPCPAIPIKMPFDGSITEWKKNIGDTTAIDNRIAVIDVTGLAAASRDFVPLGGQATFSIGQSSTVVPLIPMEDDDTGEPGDPGIESLTLTVVPPPTSNPPNVYAPYTPGNPSSATIKITDGPTVTTSSGDFLASPPAGQVPADTGALTINRVGDTTEDQVINVTLSGTATRGVDYTLSDAGNNPLTTSNLTYAISALGMSDGFISGPLADPANPPPAGRPVAYLVATRDEVVPADGCACHLPAHRIPIPMPSLPQVDDSSSAAVTNFTFKKQVGDPFHSGDVLATFDIPTVQVTVPAGQTSTDITVTPLGGGSPAAVQTVSASGMFLPLKAPASAFQGGYLSGPVAGPDNPPPVGKPIAYLVPTLAQVQPADSNTLPAGAIPVQMVQFGTGTTVGRVSGFSFIKQIGDSVQPGDAIVELQVPVSAPEDAAENGPETADITAPATGFLSGPLANTAKPPAVGSAVAYVVATRADVVPADSPIIPSGATPVTMVQIGSGTNPEFSMNFLKNVGDGVQSGDAVARLIVPETATEDALEGSTVYIVNTFVSPIVDVIANQCGYDGRLFVSGGCTDTAITNNRVTVSAYALDLNRNTNFSYDWSATDNALSPVNGTSNSTFVFDPSNVADGVYTVRVTVTDTSQESTQASLVIKISKTLPSLEQDNDQDQTPPHTDGDTDDVKDTDGDGVPDVMEGYADSNNNGIPDYLDSNKLPDNVLQEIPPGTGTPVSDSFLITTDPGLALQIGDVAFAAGSNAAGITFDDIAKYGGPSLTAAQNTSDPLQSQACIANGGNSTVTNNPLPDTMQPPTCFPPYVYEDFNITRVPQPGGVARVVIPQQYPLPVNPQYRVFHPDTGWQAFVEDADNSLASCCGQTSLAQNNAGNRGNYPGSKGYCPPPGSSDYTPGLTRGDMCVELTVQDGGPNDTDGIVNHVIKDPGVVASGPAPATPPYSIPAGKGTLGPAGLAGLLGLYAAARARRRARRC